MMATATLGAGNRPSFCCCSFHRRPALIFSSPTVVLDSRNPKFHVYRSIPQPGLRFLSPWSGLKHLGNPSQQNHGHREKKGKCRGKVVYASLFGVGAPEALVIGVVALLVFGPKGLAEVARNLGKTLRAFQPTIRELQEVSREFKSTLEREIGLDEASSTNSTFRSTSFENESQQAIVDPNGTPKTGGYTSEELLKITEEELAASAAKSQTLASSPEEQQQASPKTSEDVAASPSEVKASPAAPEAATQIASTEKAEKER